MNNIYSPYRYRNVCNSGLRAMSGRHTLYSVFLDSIWLNQFRRGWVLLPPPCLPSTVPREPQGRSLSTHYMLHGSGSPCRIANQALCLQAHDSIAVEWPLFLPAICCMSIKVCSLLRLGEWAPLRTRPPLSPSEYKMHSLLSSPAWVKKQREGKMCGGQQRSKDFGGKWWRVRVCLYAALLLYCG